MPSRVLRYLQRGGGPTNFDRALCTLFGIAASGCLTKSVTTEKVLSVLSTLARN